MNDENITYFGSFGVEYIPKEVKTFVGNKNICEITILWDYNLFSPTDKEKSDKTELTTKRNILNNSKLKVYFYEYILKRWR